MNVWTITRDGVQIATAESEWGAVGVLHRLQSGSAWWAISFEGYDVVSPDGSKWSGMLGDMEVTK